MVEYETGIDQIFRALADPVRRDIIERTTSGELTVNSIAVEYDMSLAAVSKHLRVLEEANLVSKRKDGRYVFVSSNTDGMKDAAAYLEQYQQAWSEAVNGPPSPAA